jgi:hypothetical protein
LLELSLLLSVILSFCSLCDGAISVESNSKFLRVPSHEEVADPHNTTSKHDYYSLPIASIELPLFAKSGTHHATIYAGHPPIPQILIVDTGSRLTGWRCDDDDEDHPAVRHKARRRDKGTPLPSQHDPYYYNPSRSTTSVVVPCGKCVFRDVSQCLPFVHVGSSRCTVRQRYTEGSSWTAFEVTDIISFSFSTTQQPGNGTIQHQHSYFYEDSIPTTVPFTFGCQTQLAGLFKTQFADGILGLERYCHLSLPGRLHQHGITNSTAFSLCLTPTTGYLGLGGAQRHRHTAGMRLTPLRQSKNKISGMYAVTVEEVWLGDTCLASANHHTHILRAFDAGTGTIFDSGTTDTYLPSVIADSLNTAWLEQTGRPFSLQPHQQHRNSMYTFEQFRILPNLRLVLAGNVTFTLTAANFMEGSSVFTANTNVQHDHNAYLLKKRLYADQPEGTGAVLGINAMLGYDILYDPDQGWIGFAPANCVSTEEKTL